MTDFATIRSRAEATPSLLAADTLILLDAVEERDRTIETLTAALRDLVHAAAVMPDAGLTDDDPRRSWWFSILVPAREAGHAALASVPQHDQGADDE